MPPRKRVRHIAWKIRQALGHGRDDAVDMWYDAGIDRHVAEVARAVRFDTVLVEYIFFSRVLDLFPPTVRKLVDTIDVFSDRHQTMRQAGLPANWYSTTPAGEAQALRRADVVLAITEADRRHFSGLVNRQVSVVSHIVPLSLPAPSTTSRGKLLFVGSANPMNAQAVQYFVQEILPIVRQEQPDVVLSVAGRVCDLLGACDDCIKLGEVTSMHQAYLDADVVINPMRFGTGLSVKTIEALGQSKPVVATSAGARGLDSGGGQVFLVADTPDAFAASVLKILADSHQSTRLSHKAYEYASNWNRVSKSALAAALGD